MHCMGFSHLANILTKKAAYQAKGSEQGGLLLAGVNERETGFKGARSATLGNCEDRSTESFLKAYTNTLSLERASIKYILTQ